MKCKGLKRIGAGLVAVGLTITLLLTGAIPVCEAGPDEKVVKIGHDVALTGPIASTYVQPTYAVNDYAKWVNGLEPGIDEALVPKDVLAIKNFFKNEGLKLEILWEDTTAINVAKSIMAYKRFKAAGVVGVISCSSMPTETLTPRYQRDEIPALFVVGLTPAMITYPVRWVFTGMAGHGPEPVTLVKWVKDNWVEERPPRFGLIGYDHSSAWESQKAMKEWAPKLDYEFVGYEIVPTAGVLDTSTEWLRLAAKKPDWVFAPACGATLVTIVKDSQRLEIQEKGIKLCSCCYGMDEVIMKPMGKAAEGWYAIRMQTVAADADLLWVKFTTELAKRYRGMHPEDVASHYMFVTTYIVVFTEAIRLAIEKVGYENLTGRAVRDALVTLKDFDTGQGYLTTITDERPYVASAGMRINLVREGKIWPISGWIPYAYEYPELIKGK